MVVFTCIVGAVVVVSFMMCVLYALSAINDKAEQIVELLGLCACREESRGSAAEIESGQTARLAGRMECALCSSFATGFAKHGLTPLCEDHLRMIGHRL